MMRVRRDGAGMKQFAAFSTLGFFVPSDFCPLRSFGPGLFTPADFSSLSLKWLLMKFCPADVLSPQFFSSIFVHRRANSSKWGETVLLLFKERR
jgi:hypothetical protein